jgi:hypothetical protein
MQMPQKTDAPPPGRSFSTRKVAWAIPAAGILIGLLLWTVSGMSEALAVHKPAQPRLVAAFVALMAAAGAIYSAAALFCRQAAEAPALRTWIVVIALGLRLTMVTGTPILEDDHYRYLWDGALVAHGLNPYSYSPGEIRQEALSGGSAPRVDLARQSGDILERVNYPGLRTIYPPVAQAAFGLAHRLAPWQLWAWRLVLSAFDLAALVVLCRLRVPVAGLLIYGWNPLLVKEVYNAVHVDALMLPFLLSAVAGIRRDRPVAATAALGVAAGVKLWPVLLLPMIWRRLIRRPRVLIASLLLSAACLAAILLPMVSGGLDRTSGLAAYSRYWEMNDALYTLLSRGVDGLAAYLALPPALSALMPRLLWAGIVVAGVIWLAWRREIAAGQQCLMAATLLFMFSPTQFPWYYLWLLPFLSLHPHPALVLYTALLPLYYLRPLMDRYGAVDIFDNVLVWAQHGPVFLWLVWDWMVRRRWDETGMQKGG